jgi:hypothetical protein
MEETTSEVVSNEITSRKEGTYKSESNREIEAEEGHLMEDQGCNTTSRHTSTLMKCITMLLPKGTCLHVMNFGERRCLVCR